MSDCLRLDVLVPAAASTTGSELRESRSKILRRALAGGGMILGGGVVIAGLPRFAASAPSPAQDAEILNFALLLEYMESAFFSEAAVNGRLTGELLEFAELFAVTSARSRVLAQRARGQGAQAAGVRLRQRDPRPGGIHAGRGRPPRHGGRRVQRPGQESHQGRARSAAKIVSVEAARRLDPRDRRQEPRPQPDEVRRLPMRSPSREQDELREVG